MNYRASLRTLIQLHFTARPGSRGAADPSPWLCPSPAVGALPPWLGSDLCFYLARFPQKDDSPPQIPEINGPLARGKMLEVIFETVNQSI